VRSINPLVEALLGNSVEPPRLRVLQGFLGPSDNEGWDRLYLDLELLRAVEVKTADIRYARQCPDADFGWLDLDTLWVDEEAELRDWGEVEQDEGSEEVDQNEHVPRGTASLTQEPPPGGARPAGSGPYRPPPRPRPRRPPRR